MAYSKQQRVIQDFALGYQSVNQASDNEKALFELYEAEHIAKVGKPSSVPNSKSKQGRHNHATIPRAFGVARVVTLSIFVGGQASQSFYFDIATPTYFHAMKRIGIGDYWVELNGIAGDAWAEAHPVVTSSSQVRITLARRLKSYGTANSGIQGHGVRVLCLERNTRFGGFEPTDFDFTLTLFAE